MSLREELDALRDAPYDSEGIAAAYERGDLIPADEVREMLPPDIVDMEDMREQLRTMTEQVRELWEAADYYASKWDEERSTPAVLRIKAAVDSLRERMER